MTDTNEETTEAALIAAHTVYRPTATLEFEGGVSLSIHPPVAPPPVGKVMINFYDPTNRGRERSLMYPSAEDAARLAAALISDGYVVVPSADEERFKMALNVLHQARDGGDSDVEIIAQILRAIG